MKSRKMEIQKNGKAKLIALTSRLGHIFGENEIDGTSILSEFLKTAYKLGQPAIDSILKHGKIAADGETLTDVATPESILATLYSLDKTRIVAMKDKAEKEMYTKGYTKAKGEVLREHEATLKTKYSIESDLQGEELYDHILAEKLKASGSDDEAVKKSVPYQQMEARLKKELADAKKAGEDKVKELETTYKKEGTFSKVGQSAIDILTGLNPILPKNATVAETYKRDFLNELKGFDYEEKDGKILVSKGGKLLEDAHGNTLSWDDHVKAIAGNRFEFAVNNMGENANNDNKDTKAKPKPVGYPAGIDKPKNETELSKALAKCGTPAEKRVVIDEYEARTIAK